MKLRLLLLFGVAAANPVSVVDAQCTVSAQRPGVALLSLTYVTNALLGARMAIRDSIPESPLGIRTGLSPARDFAFGLGTALSPGAPMLALQGGATVALTGSAPTARGATHALSYFGVAYAAGQLVEPETYRTLSTPRARPSRSAVVLANVFIPTALAFAASRGCR